MNRHRRSWLLAGVFLATMATASPSDPVAAGARAFKQQQWQTAYEYLVQPAGEGEPQAQYLLGNHYHRGELMEREPVLAHHWWQRAAEQGVVDAQLRLAAAYALGLGTERNRETAIGWYRRAADQGSAEARAILSRDEFLTASRTSLPVPDYSREADGQVAAATQRVESIAAPTGGSPAWQRLSSARSQVVASGRLSGSTPAGQELAQEGVAVRATSSPVAGDDRSSDWIGRQPADNFTLQLFSSDKRQSAERVVRELDSDLPLTIFPFERYGYRWYGVLAGSFPDIGQARLARQRLLRDNRLEKPWIRRFRSVRKSE